MTTNTKQPQPTLAKTLAPEEVRVGDFVAVLQEEYEYPEFMWSCDTSYNQDAIVRVRLRPGAPCDPLRVKAVCLPFVLVKPPKGRARTLDVRAVRRARLDPSYAKFARKALRG